MMSVMTAFFLTEGTSVRFNDDYCTFLPESPDWIRLVYGWVEPWTKEIRRVLMTAELWDPLPRFLSYPSFAPTNPIDNALGETCHPAPADVGRAASGQRWERVAVTSWWSRQVSGCQTSGFESGRQGVRRSKRVSINVSGAIE